jgi:hypothetical protein
LAYDSGSWEIEGLDEDTCQGHSCCIVSLLKAEGQERTYLIESIGAELTPSQDLTVMITELIYS